MPKEFSCDKAVKTNQIVGVKRLSLELALFRNEKGKIGCAVDQCTHRGAALSKGKVKELIAFFGKFGNKTIERQYKRVVITQKPKASAYKSQEKLFSGDSPIIQYRRILKN